MPPKKNFENQTDWLGLDFPVSASPIVSSIDPQPVADPHSVKPVGGAVSTTATPEKIKEASAPEPVPTARASDADKQKSRRNRKTKSGLQRVEAWLPKEVAESIRTAAAISGLRMTDLISNALKLKFGKDSKL